MMRQGEPKSDSFRMPGPSGGVEHHRALSLHEVGASIAAVAASGASATTNLAFRFLVLTAARPGEVLSAERDDIDLASRVWTVPARLTKNGRSRRIPLSTGAVTVLEEAFSRNPDSTYVFPSPRTGRPLGGSTLRALCRHLGIHGAVSGFRSAFHEYCVVNAVPQEHAETILGHVARGMEFSFNRTGYLEEQRSIMQSWCDFVSVQPEAPEADSQTDTS